MDIGMRAPATEGGGEWKVGIALSVLDLVPNEVLRPWLAVESFCRDKTESWPSNAALKVRMGVGSVRVVQAQLERLEDFGVLLRRQLAGNRRILVLTRRTADTLTAPEWAAMVARADRQAEGRTAVAAAKTAEKKKYRPPVRIVG